MSIEALHQELARLPRAEREKFIALLVALHDRDDAGSSQETRAQRPSDAAGGFDPVMHGFIPLHDFRPPGGFRVYEYANHPSVNGGHDFHRINFYLSQDGAFVTIWSGLLEDVIVEAVFRDRGLAPVDYTETLFRGYIEDEEQARHVLKALQLGKGFPQILRSDPTHGIVCEALG